MLQHTQYTFLNKRIPYILLFCFSVLAAQKVTIVNNANEPLIVKNDIKETIINSHHKKEFPETSKLSFSNKTNDVNRAVLLFLEPTDKLIITLEKDNKIVYTGDLSALHEYLNEKLNVDTFGKINTYEHICEKKNIGELKNTSELLLMDVLRKTKLSSIIVSPEDKISIKKLKNHIKYNWLYTVFSTINSIKTDVAFKKETINYYYKKYIERDIPKYSCNYPSHYLVIETLARNKDLLQAELPMYPIVEHTEDDMINQHLPQNCQRQYFRKKYKFLENVNGHNKQYYKKVLVEKFND